MDPLGSLRVAAGVIQFIDFGHRLLINTREIYHSASGLTHDMVQLFTIASDLSQLSDNLSSHHNIVKEIAPKPEDDDATSENEEAEKDDYSRILRAVKPKKETPEDILRRACRGCQDVSRALLEAISALHGKQQQKDKQQKDKQQKDKQQKDKLDPAQTSRPIYYYFGREVNPTLGSFATALREVWSSKTIKAYRDQLIEYRAQLTTASLAVLWYDLIIRECTSRYLITRIGKSQNKESNNWKSFLGSKTICLRPWAKSSRPQTL